MDQLAPSTEPEIEDLRRFDGSYPASAPPAARPRVEHKVTLRRLVASAGGAAVLIAIGFYGWHYWSVGRFEQSTDDAYVQADSTIIAPKVGGYLSEVLVDDNQPVKAGQLLARIDNRDFAVALDQARANVAAAQADIDNLNASMKEQQAVIAQARAAVAVDQANLTFMQQDNERYARLAGNGAGSVQMAQQARSKADIATSTLARDNAALQATEGQNDVLKAGLGKAEAELKQNQAAQQQAQLNLGYTNIVAPIDGIVGNRSLRVGQLVAAGTQLMAVVPLNNVYVVANFEETQLTDVHPGQAAEVAIDTFPGAKVQGHVESIAPASGQEFALLPPDNATGNFTKVVQRIPVKIALDPSALAGELRPGMSVVPTIDTKQAASQSGTQTASR